MQTMELNGSFPPRSDKEHPIEERKRIKREETAIQSNNNNNNKKNNKNRAFEKNKTNAPKNGRNSTLMTDGPSFCSECGNKPTHDTSASFKLKNLVRIDKKCQREQKGASQTVKYA
jgi:hypothetical protein